MIEISSLLEGRQFDLYKLEQILKPAGYTIGGNWDYDHGAFDYKLNDNGAYQYLRVPFHAVDGQLDSRGCTVEIGKPYLLSHEYQDGLDDHATSGVGPGAFNQFQEPVDKDADIPDQLKDVGKKMVEELESLLLNS
jgi:hypothetical protein